MSSLYWLASYPKSGNTWFRVFLQNLLEDADTPVVIDELSTGSIASARGWLDETLGFDTADLTQSEIDTLRPHVYDWLHDATELGYHKIHDAYTMVAGDLPIVGVEGTKGALYIVRNPLDVAPSYANHCQCSLDQAIEHMGNPKHCVAKHKHRLTSQVRQQLLTWSEHVRSWLDAPKLNRFVIRYEDMLNNPLATFTAACQFLELPLDQARIQKAIAFSDFKVLSQQEQQHGFKERLPHTQQFFRQGKSGNWRDKLSEQQVTRIIHDHGEMMQRLGYLDSAGQPLVVPQPWSELMINVS